MTAADLVDNVMMRVRTIIRRHEPCASRHMLDVSLGDFERDLRHDLDRMEYENERDIEREIRWAREEWEEERREEEKTRAAQAKKPKARKAAGP
jgi:hypothetical protein